MSESEGLEAYPGNVIMDPKGASSGAYRGHDCIGYGSGYGKVIVNICA